MMVIYYPDLKNNYSVLGVDASKKMCQVAKKKE